MTVYLRWGYPHPYREHDRPLPLGAVRQQARCERDAGHIPPVPGCSCGYYATRDWTTLVYHWPLPPERLFQVAPVGLTVEDNWGTIRAERLQVLGEADPYSIRLPGPIRRNWERRIDIAGDIVALRQLSNGAGTRSETVKNIVTLLCHLRQLCGTGPYRCPKRTAKIIRDRIAGCGKDGTV